MCRGCLLTHRAGSHECMALVKDCHGAGEISDVAQEAESACYLLALWSLAGHLPPANRHLQNGDDAMMMTMMIEKPTSLGVVGLD